MGHHGFGAGIEVGADGQEFRIGLGAATEVRIGH
jgi:hypothetical protein